MPGVFGHTLSAESRKKISDARKGIKFSSEHKEKLRLAKLGKPRAGDPTKWKHTAQAKLKMSLGRRGENANGWRGGLSSLNRRLRRSTTLPICPNRRLRECRSWCL